MFLMGRSSSHPVKERISAGLPNIKGKVKGDVDSIGAVFESATGSFNTTVSQTPNYPANVVSGSATRYYELNIDASRSNSIYGNSNTVQPPAVSVIICIKAVP